MVIGLHARKLIHPRCPFSFSFAEWLDFTLCCLTGWEGFGLDCDLTVIQGRWVATRVLRQQLIGQGNRVQPFFLAFATLCAVAVCGMKTFKGLLNDGLCML